MNETIENRAKIPETQERATNPLSCQNCVKKEFCKEICLEIEALLPKKTTGKHKKEITVSNEYAESLGVQRAFKLRFGKKYDIFKHESAF